LLCSINIVIMSVHKPYDAGNINKTLSPVDSRALTWLAFGRCCLDETRHGGSQPLSWNAAAFTSVAVALSQQPPFATDLQGLSIQVNGSVYEHQETRVTLNSKPYVKVLRLSVVLAAELP
jgi:hypothetical protein